MDYLNYYWNHLYYSILTFATLPKSVGYNSTVNISDPVQYLPGVGPLMARKLLKLNIQTVEDLINHYPFRYEDFSNNTSVLEAQIGDKVTLQGELWSISNIYTRSKKILTKGIFNDGTSSIELIWFNQPWLEKSLSSGDQIQISGKLDKKGSKLSIMAPIWERLNQDSTLPSIHTGRLVPIYPETSGVNSKWLRGKISVVLPNVLNQIKDPLPEEIKGGMISQTEALSQIHFPSSSDELIKAQARLAFNEMFFIQLATLQKRLQWQNQNSTPALKVNQAKLSDFIKALPFKLTNSQKKVLDEIIVDLKKPTPMNRLIQGEVGSGKTVVAAMAAYLSFLNHLKTILMAPTEILAFQHYSTITKLLEPYNIKVGIYTGSKKQAQDADVIIGTHALLSSSLNQDQIGLIIVDEQQRFGVEQRSLLRSKHSLPHFLTMTATPIPRTVALTLYGDLDLSIIDELPQGRQKIRTYVVPQTKRQDAYGFISKKITKGDQAYIITPLIEESETSKTAKAAKSEFEYLKGIFPKSKLGLLHGKLSSKDKEQVITNFKNHSTDILVSTSVVEVGMDIPNATIMVIEGAERFGLAQLHQLRGRVGRGKKESFCLLFSEVEDQPIVDRLKNLEKTLSGLELSEIDLKIRGGGDIFGVRQSGYWKLKIAKFSDLPLIEKSRESARKILENDPNLDKYPQLRGKLHSLARDIMPD